MVNKDYQKVILIVLSAGNVSGGNDFGYFMIGQNVRRSQNAVF